MSNMAALADEAEVIICGYAISKCDIGFRVINLHDLRNCSIFYDNGDLIETNVNYPPLNPDGF